MRHILVFGVLALVSAGLDFWSKERVFGFLSANEESIVVEHILRFKTTTNKGIIFGAFQDSGPLFLVISILAAPVILGIFLSVRRPRWIMTVSLALILGGTLGNMYDRVVFDHVRDFIEAYDWIQFPIFNLADSFICVGVFLLSVEMLFFDDAKKKVASIAGPEEGTSRGGTAEAAGGSGPSA